MKKAIVILFIAFTASSQVQAQSDSTGRANTTTNTGSTKYFYYPESNVYFNEANGNYSYYDPSTSTWTSNSQLPSTYSIDKNTTKNSVYYNGKDVWKENAAHQKKYPNMNNKSGAPKP